ncbi:MAG: hypothetical protein M0Z49_10640 [Chloroflexi bacterium]|nr:hypothetical protein [Chloroflexota bacterium]
MTAELRQQRARLGGLTVAMRGTVNTGPARAAQRSALVREIDPDGTLPPAELEKRLAAAQRLRLVKMAYASARARSKPH